VNIRSDLHSGKEEIAAGHQLIAAFHNTVVAPR
jgi:hypothetical protein